MRKVCCKGARRRGVDDDRQSPLAGSAGHSLVDEFRNLVLKHENFAVREQVVACLVGRDREIGAGHDDGAVIALIIEDRDTHSGPEAIENRNSATIDFRSIETREQGLPETVLSDRADHGGRHALTPRRDRLVATLAAEFGRPAPASHCLPLAGSAGRIDHDVVVQASDDDDGRRRRVSRFVHDRRRAVM